MVIKLDVIWVNVALHEIYLRRVVCMIGNKTFEIGNLRYPRSKSDLSGILHSFKPNIFANIGDFRHEVLGDRQSIRGCKAGD
jgi:hypothetical protein